MKKSSAIIIALIGGLLLCSCKSGKRDNLTGKEFEGYYYSCEYISLDFKPDSTVNGHFSSTDFVGSFSDDMYGHYEYAHPYITIVWEKADPKNDVYKKVLSNPDSLIVNEALDTLWLFEGEEKFTLPKYSLLDSIFDIDKNASIPVQIGEFLYRLQLFALLFFFKYIIPIGIVLAIVLLAKKIMKKRKKEQT